MPAPKEFLDFVDKNADKFIQRLSEAVSYQSVSGNPDHRQDVINMSKWMNSQLRGVGIDTQLVELGNQKDQDGNDMGIPLPPVVLGRIGNDTNKKTVLVYGHLDVQPAAKSDGWSTDDPFKLEIFDNGQLVGRGATDDKGPVLGWLNVLQYHYEANKLGDLPVNLRFCFEAMEESGSQGLDNVVKKEFQSGGWFHGTDCVSISDNYWLNTRTPAITYGLRGIAYYKVTVEGPAKDLHSGMFGRMVHEPMTDLIKIMSALVNVDGSIPVPLIDSLVPPPTEQEADEYKKLDYTVQDLDESVGASIGLSDDKVKLLMGRMRECSLSLHGIEGASSGPETATVIPAKVTGKFSIRLVPPLTPDEATKRITEYVQYVFDNLGTKNKMNCRMIDGGLPWVANTSHWSYVAAKAATEAVWKKTPDMTREGGSIPVALTFADALGNNDGVLLLPMGRGDDGAHSTNEKIDRSNFIEGTKLLGTYLYEIPAAAAAAKN
ncbi:Zn-dependent exopeptidase [Dendrothele bispora CBS 962.96]|uniref:Zn-dependent exopeptidase n=1 Tax=Dendrothele bispora (strain CBS 962.96) TaxID=1314807 RepID=A0A4S8MUX1_DENBC|nr:Zn-dependent exopeptidase [Dendrothele bispora CBS 962.96]